MESMERIDVLKGIEQILVEKAYETGHISHRADGDWQKTNNGWVRVKGNSAQPASQAQETTPVESVEYSEIVKQDFESVPSSIKDKMFDVALQYRNEWEEDDDEEVRQMADQDVEQIAQMLWDDADEETRNSWLGSDNSNEEDQYGEITEEDLVETSDGNDKEQETTDTVFSKKWNLLPQDVKDKMFDVAQQYKSEWAEDSDEDIRSMAEEDVEDISQMLWDDADEDQRSDWIGKSAVRDMRSTLATKNMGF